MSKLAIVSILFTLTANCAFAGEFEIVSTLNSQKNIEVSKPVEIVANVQVPCNIKFVAATNPDDRDELQVSCTSPASRDLEDLVRKNSNALLGKVLVHKEGTSELSQRLLIGSEYLTVYRFAELTGRNREDMNDGDIFKLKLGARLTFANITAK